LEASRADTIALDSPYYYPLSTTDVNMAIHRSFRPYHKP